MPAECDNLRQIPVITAQLRDRIVVDKGVGKPKGAYYLLTPALRLSRELP
jgi:hypothetical protein